jgi:hypothetical protein
MPQNLIAVKHITNLSSMLKSVKFHDDFNKKLIENSLPSSLSPLFWKILQSANHLSSSLTHLTFGNCYAQPLPSSQAYFFWEFI